MPSVRSSRATRSDRSFNPTPARFCFHNRRTPFSTRLRPRPWSRTCLATRLIDPFDVAAQMIDKLLHLSRDLLHVEMRIALARLTFLSLLHDTPRCYADRTGAGAAEFHDRAEKQSLQETKCACLMRARRPEATAR